MGTFESDVEALGCIGICFVAVTRRMTTLEVGGMYSCDIALSICQKIVLRLVITLHDVL